MTDKSTLEDVCLRTIQIGFVYSAGTLFHDHRKDLSGLNLSKQRVVDIMTHRFQWMKRSTDRVRKSSGELNMSRTACSLNRFDAVVESSY